MEAVGGNSDAKTTIINKPPTVPVVMPINAEKPANSVRQKNKKASTFGTPKKVVSILFKFCIAQRYNLKKEKIIK